MEEPLEGEETSHRDGEDKLAEWVHGHPTPLWEDGEKEHKGIKRKVEKLAMICFITTFCKQKNNKKLSHKIQQTLVTMFPFMESDGSLLILKRCNL